jgi:ABC transport system ATP-binding/permease protein
MRNIDYKLLFYHDGKLFKKVAVEKGYSFSLIVGSGSEVDIKINNSRVSRSHLQLVYNPSGDLFVQDLDSTNGTFLNGNKLKSSENKKLKNKDRLQLAGLNGIVILIEDPSTSFKSNTSESTKTDIVEKLKTKRIITIGRNKNCDIVFNSNIISKTHASIERSVNGGYILKDLNSRNGVFVNGRKIKGVAKIGLKDKIYIGRHLLSLVGRSQDLSDELAITARGIEKTYPNGVKALKKMDLAIPSGSLLAIMGPSGCGKSTLLKALNGDTPPSKGKVFLFNQELFSNYEYLKTQIGYVPQDDIIHRQLTVSQCLYFTAKLRLENPSDEIIEKKISRILEDLNIEKQRNELISDLSGGQRKRVSIAVELITEPLILFLDEPTSPLDPQTVEEFLIILKRLANRGTTVVMVTHKPEDLDYMDNVLFLAEGGHLVYDGDVKEYKPYFNSKSAVAVFAKLCDDQKDEWVSKFRSSRSLTENTGSSNKKAKSRISFLNQYYWLTRRYFRIKTNDTSNSFWMLVQAPIIALLIAIIFDEITPAVLFIIAISSIWLGANNAAREIVSEQAIFKRERMYNLDIFTYVISKMSVLSFFSIVQSAIFIMIISMRYYDGVVSFHNAFSAFLWMSYLSIASTFLGLYISSFFKTAEKVMQFVPIILIPQIMLAGLVTTINNAFVELISYFTLSRWGTEGFTILQEDVVITQNIMSIEYVTEAVPHLLDQFHSTYQDLFGNIAGTLKLDIIFITIMIVVLNILIYKTLKNKDSVTI